MSEPATMTKAQMEYAEQLITDEIIAQAHIQMAENHLEKMEAHLRQVQGDIQEAHDAFCKKRKEAVQEYAERGHQGQACAAVKSAYRAWVESGEPLAAAEAAVRHANGLVTEAKLAHGEVMKEIDKFNESKAPERQGA